MTEETTETTKTEATETPVETEAPVTDAEAVTKDADTGTATTETKPAAEPADWRDSIADADLRKYADQFTSPTDMAGAGMKARKAVSNAIPIPGKDATDEDQEKYQAALREAQGVPEKVEDYTYEREDFGEAWNAALESDEQVAMTRSYLDQAHELGIPPAAANAQINKFWRDTIEQQEAAATETARKVEVADAALRKEWGPDHDKNTEGAKRAFAALAGNIPGAVEMLQDAQYEGVPLEQHPVFRKTFASIGRKMMEGAALASVTDSDEVSSLEAEEQELRSREDYWENAAAQARVREITQQITPRNAA
ncbi:MAG: hypothetical protein GY953_39335 [bacterium]|nr:hypothetical protein [bacterium]